MSFSLSNCGPDQEKLFFQHALKNPKYLTSINPGFFENELDVVANVAKKFYEEFNEVPSKDQVNALIRNSKYAEEITPNIVNTIFDVNYKEYDEDWLQRGTETFIQYKNFEKELFSMIKYVKMQDFNQDNTNDIITKAISMISDKGSLSFDDDLGLDFFNPTSHYQIANEKVPSGKDFVDRLCGGYDKKTLICYAGEQNIGKSIWLANDAVNAVKMGQNTLFISAEMADRKVVKRIGSNLLNIRMDKYDQESGNAEMMQRKLQQTGQGVMPPGHLTVKEFPTSQATVPMIEQYIKDLEAAKHMKIQVVVIDYINILANYRNPNTENTYMKIKQIAEDLRAMAVRNDLLIITATQINRGAWDANEVKMEHIAESAGLGHTVDMMYAIIQDSEMHAKCEYFLKILKIRDGSGKNTKCKFNINYDYMRLTETSEVFQVDE